MLQRLSVILVQLYILMIALIASAIVSSYNSRVWVNWNEKSSRVNRTKESCYWLFAIYSDSLTMSCLKCTRWFDWL